MRRRDFLMTAVMGSAALRAGANTGMQNAALHPQRVGFQAMAHPELLPFLRPNGTQTKQFSSYDPSGANNDGNFRSSYTKYVDANGEFVIFDAHGPGCLYRQQYNAWAFGGFKQAGLGHIKYYFDDESKARVDLPIDDFFSGKQEPFTAPLAFLDPKLRFGISYYPFPFRGRLKITTTEDLTKLQDPYNAAWYQYTYITYPDQSAVTSWSGPDEDSSVVRRQWNHLGEDPKPRGGNVALSSQLKIPNGTAKTLAALSGAGSISSIKIKVAPYAHQVFYKCILRIYWEDSDLPAVDLPLGHFFGGGGGAYDDCKDVPEKRLQTLMFGFDGTTHEFYCFWPMPYWKSARLELQNDSGIDLASVECALEYKPARSYAYPEGACGHFYAKRTVSRDSGRGLRALAFEETGRGHLVGQAFYSSQYAMDGDEFTYIDGSRTPQVHGDGTEDDHNQGFGGDAYQKPLWGGLVNGFQGAYRIYLGDTYIFNSQIQMNYEFSREGGNDFGGETDVTVWYYKQPISNLLLTDQVDIGDLTSEDAHQYSVAGQTWSGTKRSGYDGYERDYEFDLCQDSGRAFNGHSEFAVRIAPNNQGVRLRRRIFRCGNGIQRADVYVDGVKVRERCWDTCTLSSAPFYQGWFDSDFEIPASYSSGKHQIKVRVQHRDGGTKPEINEFYYWVYSYCPRTSEVRPVSVGELAATAKSGFRVDLTWSPQAAAEPVQCYQVYRRSGSSEWRRIATSNAARFSDTRVQPGTTYHYRVMAVGVEGREGNPSTEVHASTEAASQRSTAQYVGTDDKTSGNWAAKYGSDGFLMLRYFYGRDCQALPEYVSAVDSGHFAARQFSTWNTSTGASLLTSPISYCAKYLGALETGDSDALVVYVNDLRPHGLGIYVCDFDKAGREQSIELLGLDGQIIAPAQIASSFASGRWLRYHFSGSFRLRVRNLNSSTTAVLSALMFDPSS